MKQKDTKSKIKPKPKTKNKTSILKTYKGKQWYIAYKNAIRKMNALYFAKVFAFTMIGVMIVFHLISVMNVCKFIARSPKELPQTIKKEQLCAKNNYDC